MFIASELLPPWLVIASTLLMLATCGLSARLADWSAVRRVPARLHLLLGGSIICLLLWLLSLRIIENLWLHFLGVTTLVTLVGLRFSLLCGAFATLAYALLINQPLTGIPVAWIISVAAPAASSRLVVRQVRRLRSNNLFLYLLGAGFGGGIVSMLVMVVTALPLLWLIGQQVWVSDAVGNWPLLLLILFPEGFINGMVVTTLTVFYPQLVKTFDDKHYLGE